MIFSLCSHNYDEKRVSFELVEYTGNDDSVVFSFEVDEDSTRKIQVDKDKLLKSVELISNHRRIKSTIPIEEDDFGGDDSFELSIGIEKYHDVEYVCLRVDGAYFYFNDDELIDLLRAL